MSVTFQGNGDREQSIRVEKLETLGRVKMIHPEDLAPEKFASQILHYLQQQPKLLDLDNLPKPKLIDKLRGTVIGSVGRFRDKKGLEYLLDACAELQTEFTLLLVGDFVKKEKGYWEREL